MMATVIWGAPHWTAAAIGLLAAAAGVLLWSYGRARAGRSIRLAGAVLKGLALTALVLSLLEPLLTGSRPRRGANAFVLLADNSQSLLIRDAGEKRGRGEWVRSLLHDDAGWRTRLGQDFDVRTYAFDSHLRAIDGPDDLEFDGVGSSLETSLQALSKRFRGLPLAGVLVFTDGNRTDTLDIDWSQSPPIFPVIPPSRGVAKDVGVRNVTVSQANFETAPVVLRADITAKGYPGERIITVVADETGKEIERQALAAPEQGDSLGVRFQFRPETRDVGFYTVRAFAESDPPNSATGDDVSDEQTRANNGRLAVVDQGGGPYRVLYVSGRPNWEFKFLRRAIDADEQVDLIGLLRIARRQPKFDFQASGSRSTSPLFEGFDGTDPDTTEHADEPVLVRLGTEDEAELRDGFPKTADELYRYHAVILDDLEAGFFTPDQLALLRNFVSVRGGGLLMLGGPETFADGSYDRTPVGDLLPVYLRKTEPNRAQDEYRLVLTREGWLQPWVRTRKTEEDERRRLASLPSFQTLSRAGGVKPGAVVLSEVRDMSAEAVPALVAQQFGRGHVAALMVGDLWRWSLRREKPDEDDFDRSWRQTVRWLIADVPGRAEIDVRPTAGGTSSMIELTVRVRDAQYRPLDDSAVEIKVTLPDGEERTLKADPAGGEPGAYAATYATKQPGAYRFSATANALDGSLIGSAEAGWAAQPAADEFARLEPNRDYLSSIAAATGGELIDGDALDAFVASLASRDVPITEPWTSPLWHHPLYFLVAIACLIAEWGLRRVNGLP